MHILIPGGSDIELRLINETGIQGEAHKEVSEGCSRKMELHAKRMGGSS